MKGSRKEHTFSRLQSVQVQIEIEECWSGCIPQRHCEREIFKIDLLVTQF